MAKLESPLHLDAQSRGPYYEFKYGDQPLSGYTIQRGVGRGGFGEVYYALSDSGREVALKIIQKGEQVELRGISQCMNLKSPHLVTIFDMMKNDQGRWFVIMEFVNGVSLSDVIRENRGGLKQEEAAYFLREIAKGLSYLHEAGIVHRDLKPGNIFYENGYVMIGDYGLSKAIGAAPMSGQTITVGTLHYMAPEIGDGRYDRTIDIYAMGVMLYEMLTGEAPYHGQSPAEILMQHVRGEPNLDKINEPFASVIKKAMAKDPDERYQTVQEMVEALYEEDHIRQSVTHFRPESLTDAAKKAAQKLKADLEEVEEESRHVEQALIPAQQVAAHQRQMIEVGQVGPEDDEFLGYEAERVVVMPGEDTLFEPMVQPHTRVDEVVDHLNFFERLVLVWLTGALIGGAVLAIGGWPMAWESLVYSIHVGSAVIVGGFGLMIANYALQGRLETDSAIVSRVAYGGMASMVAGILCSPFILLAIFVPAEMEVFQATFMALAPALFVVNWHKRLHPLRNKRMSFSTAMWAGVFGGLGMALFRGELLAEHLVLDIASATGMALAAMIGARCQTPEKHNRPRLWRMNISKNK